MNSFKLFGIEAKTSPQCTSEQAILGSVEDVFELYPPAGGGRKKGKNRAQKGHEDSGFSQLKKFKGVQC